MCGCRLYNFVRMDSFAYQFSLTIILLLLQLLALLNRGFVVSP